MPSSALPRELTLIIVLLRWAHLVWRLRLVVEQQLQPVRLVVLVELVRQFQPADRDRWQRWRQLVQQSLFLVRWIEQRVELLELRQ